MVAVCALLHEWFTSFSAYQAAPNMSELPKTVVFFGYKSIKSSWLNTEAKVGSKTVFTLVAYVLRLASTSTHLFVLRIETAVISNQTVELLLPLKCKNSRIATTDLEYRASLTITVST